MSIVLALKVLLPTYPSDDDFDFGFDFDVDEDVDEDEDVGHGRWYSRIRKLLRGDSR